MKETKYIFVTGGVVSSLGKGIISSSLARLLLSRGYSVTVQKDGVYAERIPDSFVNNTGVIFKKQVKKAMKYYNEYKDADEYTYVSNVSDEYRDFIPVAKQIQDSDEIIIRNPFFIYQTLDDAVLCSYYYFAEKNGQKLCVFSIDIEPETGNVSFCYNKMEDSHFVYDAETIGETLFYQIDEILYAETPAEASVVWNRQTQKGTEMLGVGNSVASINREDVDKVFKKMSYREKKDEILEQMTNPKNGKLIKKVEENLKMQLKDEYVAPEKDTKESDGTGDLIKFGIYAVLGMVILGIVVLIGERIWMKKQKN